MAKRKVVTYEISRVEDFMGDGQSIVFHKQGDVYAMDSALAVKHMKPGNPFESEQAWIDRCIQKAEQSGVALINNIERVDA